MNKLIVVILVIAVAVAGVLIWDHESRVEYTVDPGTSSEMLDTVMFTVSADLDEAATVTLWCDGEKLSTVLNVSEWTAPAGSWEQTFLVPLPDGLTESGFYDRLTVEFDGRAGIQV